ncbi:hypothetical protein [Xylocopilactobacillus apicola]|uniref:hypothetical protein n=1 Tax=Xylocopilactobacillus apicola TaxID=2932184 RepID=UPI002952E481|nr:hypothetical protein [Xylocopilactobacillus apicola]
MDYNEFDDDKAIHQFHLTGEDAVDGVKRLITIVTFELHKPIINVEDPVSRDNLEAMRSIYIDGVLDSDAPKYVQAVYNKSNYYNLTKEDQLEVDAIESAIDQREAELSYAKIEGKNEEKFEVAQSLLAQGIDLNIIIKATKLSAEEIEKLK